MHASWLRKKRCIGVSQRLIFASGMNAHRGKHLRPGVFPARCQPTYLFTYSGYIQNSARTINGKRSSLHTSRDTAFLCLPSFTSDNHSPRNFSLSAVGGTVKSTEAKRRTYRAVTSSLNLRHTRSDGLFVCRCFVFVFSDAEVRSSPPSHTAKR